MIFILRLHIGPPARQACRQYRGTATHRLESELVAVALPPRWRLIEER
jgi:hypothetical protein